MALRKPSVVTDIGGIPEVVEHESTGLVVPPRNPSRLAESLLRLLRNPTEANQLAEAAHGRYEKALAPEEMARRIERIFVRVTDRDSLSIEQAENTRDAA